MAKKTLTLSLALVALLCVPLALSAFALPDDSPASKGQDDVLDDLLKKVEEKGSKPAEKPAPGKPAAKGENAPASTGAKPSGDVATKDKDLDNLLERLGATEDKPAPEAQGGARRRERRAHAAREKPAEKKNDPGALSGKDRDLDEHLEEAAGKRRKKKQQEEGEDGGPLSQVIKEMREVEERLGKPDTGEETRKKQAEIVKKLQTLVEQSKRSQSQSQAKKKSRAMAKGQQPGQQKGEQAGTTGGNAPFTKPQKPTDRRSLAGGKELWGDLPPEVRQDLDNVMKEGFLPARDELIRLYYLSLSKKRATRGE